MKPDETAFLNVRIQVKLVKVGENGWYERKLEKIYENGLKWIKWVKMVENG